MVHVYDRGATAGGLTRQELFPLGGFAGLEGRCGHVDDDLGALLAQHCDGVSPIEFPSQCDGVPNILADADPDLATCYFNAIRLLSALKVTRLVKDVVRGQERLYVDVLHLAFGEQGRGVLERPPRAIGRRTHKAHQRRNIAALFGERLDGGDAVSHEVAFAQKVARRVTKHRQFPEDDQVGPGVGGAPDTIRYPFRITDNVADYRVQLSQSDLHIGLLAAHVAQSPNRWWDSYRDVPLPEVFFHLADSVSSIVEDRRHYCRVRLSFRQHAIDVFGPARATGGDHGNRNRPADRRSQFYIIPDLVSVGVDGGQENLARAEALDPLCPLNGIDTCRRSTGVYVHLPRLAGALGVDRHDDGLIPKRLGRFLNEPRAADGRGVDRYLLRPGSQQGLDVVHRVNPSTDCIRDKYLPPDASSQPASGFAGLYGGCDVEKDQLVSSGLTIGLTAFDGVARIAEFHERPSLNDPAVLDVQARNNPFGQHLRFHLQSPLHIRQKLLSILIPAGPDFSG